MASAGPQASVLDAARAKRPGPRVLATVDAIEIFRARDRLGPGDTAILLAERFGVSVRAVQDIWNLRTWAKSTMGLWTAADVGTVVRRKLCESCRGAELNSIDDACGACKSTTAALVKQHKQRRSNGEPGAGSAERAGPGCCAPGVSSTSRPAAHEHKSSLVPGHEQTAACCAHSEWRGGSLFSSNSPPAPSQRSSTAPERCPAPCDGALDFFSGEKRKRSPEPAALRHNQRRIARAGAAAAIERPITFVSTAVTPGFLSLRYHETSSPLVF